MSLDINISNNEPIKSIIKFKINTNFLIIKNKKSKFPIYNLERENRKEKEREELAARNEQAKTLDNIFLSYKNQTRNINQDKSEKSIIRKEKKVVKKKETKEISKKKKNIHKTFFFKNRSILNEKKSRMITRMDTILGQKRINKVNFKKELIQMFKHLNISFKNNFEIIV